MEPSKEGHTPFSYNTTTTPDYHHGGTPAGPYPSGSPEYSQSSSSSPTNGLSHEKTEVADSPVVEQMENVETPDGLHRGLKLRHMVMIAISGTIGTGLFLTSGKTIATAGPLGARRLFSCLEIEVLLHSKLPLDCILTQVSFSTLINSSGVCGDRYLAGVRLPGDWRDCDTATPPWRIHVLGNPIL